MTRHFEMDGRVLSRDEIDMFTAGVLDRMHVTRLPEGYDSLEFLAPVFSCLKWISVTDADCRDLARLRDMPMLERIYLNRLTPRAPVDLSVLSHLKEFIGPGRKEFISLSQLPNLVHLELDAPISSGLLENLSARLEFLEIRGARNLAGLPPGPQFTGLRDIVIHGPRIFDCSTLTQVEEPAYIELHSIKEITNIRHLSKWGRDTIIKIENCGPLPEPEEFLGLLDSTLKLVGGRTPIDRDFIRTAIGDIPEGWSLPPFLQPR